MYNFYKNFILLSKNNFFSNKVIYSKEIFVSLFIKVKYVKKKLKFSLNLIKKVLFHVCHIWSYVQDTKKKRLITHNQNYITTFTIEW